MVCPALLRETRAQVAHARRTGCSHEDWVWEVRGDKNVRSVFEKVYDTEDLIVSFDCINISAPLYALFLARLIYTTLMMLHSKRSKPNTPWAHQDQDVRLFPLLP